MNALDVVTIDGPGGSGKGTIAIIIARKLNWHYLDSGAHFRALAFLAIKKNISSENVLKLTQLLLNFELESSFSANEDVSIFLNGKDITKEIREEECGSMASKIAIHKEVRATIVELQRKCFELPGLVTDGRDMGTVVFPLAKWKIYLYASLEVTAKRRYQQLKKNGVDVTLEHVLKEMKRRDMRDSKRKVAPLMVAQDAYFLDTDNLKIEQVVDKALLFIETGSKT